jgi:hypothetical protein
MLEIYRHDIAGSFYSWKAGIWIIAASLIFSSVTYLLLTDKGLSLLDQGEMLFTLAEVILSLGIIITASSFVSNKIELGTFESLPASDTCYSMEIIFSEIAHSNNFLGVIIHSINSLSCGSC